MRPARELLALSAAELARGYKQRSFTPVDVLAALLQAIGEDAVHAFVCLDERRAMQAARESTERWKRQAPASGLDGVPVSIKDLVSMAGLPLRRGSLTTPETAAAQDAPAVELLRTGGAVLFGKTSTTEMGSAIHGDSPFHGRTLNPLDPGRTVGGSSCGAAAQLASGWGPLAVGSDAGGSVRIPASYTGMAAFKPSFGNIPAWPQSPLVEFAHLGPMARTAEDLALAMQVLGQPHRADPASLYGREGCAPARRRPGPLRVGYCARVGGHCTLDDAVAAAWRNLLGRPLHEAWPGQALELVPVDLEWLDMSEPLWAVWCSRMVETCMGMDEAVQALLGADAVLQYRQGLAADGRALALARRDLREAAMRLSTVFAQDIDLLLTPATPGVAPPAGEFADARHPQYAQWRAAGNWLAATPFSHPFNVTQQPALVIPWARNESGLPFGLQLVGRRYADDLVLEFGTVLQRWLEQEDL